MERKIKTEELAAAIAEQTKLNQKLMNSEKEKQNLLDLVKLHESQIVEKDKKIQQCEVELKEAEQMKNTIMSLMQGRSFKNK
jgi:predicted  nucleic acid-binding Zn-ribbon protein